MASRKGYTQRPRNKRRDRFVSVRWRIACDTQGRGVFACRHLLPGSPGWGKLGLDADARQTHADVWFLSRRHARDGWWYSASLSTVDEAVCAWIANRIEKTLQAAIGGRVEYNRAYWREVARLWGEVKAEQWEQAPIAAGCTLDFSYPHAVRLVGVLEDETLDPDAIIAFIQDFLDRGEASRLYPIDWARHREAIARVVEHQTRLYARLGATAD